MPAWGLFLPFPVDCPNRLAYNTGAAPFRGAFLPPAGSGIQDSGSLSDCRLPGAGYKTPACKRLSQGAPGSALFYLMDPAAPGKIGNPRAGAGPHGVLLSMGGQGFTKQPLDLRLLRLSVNGGQYVRIGAAVQFQAYKAGVFPVVPLLWRLFFADLLTPLSSEVGAVSRPNLFC